MCVCQHKQDKSPSTARHHGQGSRPTIKKAIRSCKISHHREIYILQNSNEFKKSYKPAHTELQGLVAYLFCSTGNSPL